MPWPKTPPAHPAGRSAARPAGHPAARPAALLAAALLAACGQAPAPRGAPTAPPAGAGPGRPEATPARTARPANFNALALGKAALGTPAAARPLPQGSPRAPVHRNAPLGVPSFAWASPAGTASIARAGPGAKAVARRLGPVEAARAHLAAVAPAHGLGPADVRSAVATRVHDTGRGPVVVTFRQRPGGVEVFREEASVALTRDLVPVAMAGSLSPASAAPAAAAAAPSLGAAAAVAAALVDLTGEAFAAADLVARGAHGPWRTFDLAPATAAARAERFTRAAGARQVWFRLPAGLEPAWQVEVSLERAGDGEPLDYGLVLSARDGRLLFRIDHLADQAFDYRVWASDPATGLPDDGPQGLAGTPHPTGLPDGYQAPFTAPALVTRQSLPFSRNDPWLPAGAVETRGNNVDAYADLSQPNGFTSTAEAPGSLDRRATITSPGRFDHPYDLALGPVATAAQIQAGVTQVFYDVNALHDWFYDAGFDEPSGNAQLGNYGRGGVENDPLLAEAQDASGTNNANMATPPDGFSPRMQMFLWNNGDLARVVVTAPAALAGARVAAPGAFGPQTFSRPGPLEAAVPADACTTLAPAGGPGRIALVDRGGCTFVLKVKAAQDAGYAGALVRIVDPTQGLVTMGGADATITIPALLLDAGTGAALGDALPGGVTVSMERTVGLLRDGTLDALIVAHEWGHYLSNRLAQDAAGLDTPQARAMGEGWGDFLSLLQAVRAEDAAEAANAGWAGVYATSGFVASGVDGLGAPNQGYYYGIRRTPYSTDLSRSPLTFRHVSDGVALPQVTPPLAVNGAPNAEVHNAGEVWASVLWECYAALLRDTLGPAPRLTFEEASRRMREYLVASLKLLPPSPTFLEGRDALLAAAAAGDPADAGRFWAAFATRGFGVGASGPLDRFGADNAGVVESFTLGGDFALEGVAFGQVTSGCDDGDGTLDDGEVGTLTLTLRNTGSGPVRAGTATISTTSPHLAFPDGPAVAVGAAEAGALTTATVRVAAAGAPTAGLAALEVAFAGGDLADPFAVAFQLRLSVDVQPSASATDTLEADRFAWEAAADLALFTGARFARVAASPADHSILGPDPAAAADLTLTSPPLRVGTGPFSVSWRHAFSFEADPEGAAGRSFYDGGVVELSDDDGLTWRDVGGPLYNGVLTATGFGNPLDGRPAFVAASPGAATGLLEAASLDLGAACAGGSACAGKTVRLRFRIGSDLNEPGPLGWALDDVAFTGVLDTPFDLVTADARACRNRPPAASAGAAQEVAAGATVFLDGSASRDPDAGDALAYAWAQLSGPAVTLAGADGPAPSFTAPAVSGPTELGFGLTVSDGQASSPLATVTVTVLRANRPPTADAGLDLVADERAPVALAGAGQDPDGDALTFAWAQLSGPAVTLAGADGPAPTFTAPEVTATTELVFGLTVRDGQAASPVAAVTVTVLQVNRAPTADAGRAVSVDPGATVTLDAAGSSDPDAGDRLTFAWAQTGGPAVALSGADGAAPRFTAPAAAAVLGFEVVVSDGAATSTASVAVTVRAPPAPPPAPSRGGGCSAGDASPASLAAIALGLVLRRRRRGRAGPPA